jgi:hypothetical protein
MKELNKQFKALPPNERQYWKDREAEDKIRYAEQLKQTGGVRRIMRPPRTYNSTKRNLKKNKINLDEPITDSFDIVDVTDIPADIANESITDSFDIVDIDIPFDIANAIPAKGTILDSFDLDFLDTNKHFDELDDLFSPRDETISETFDLELEDLDDFLNDTIFEI